MPRTRPGSLADVPAAARLWNTHLGDAFPLTQRVLALTVFEDPNFLPGDCVVAVEDEAVVGFAWLKRWRSPASVVTSVGFLGGLVVARDRVRQGIGSALVRLLEDGLRREGCTRIEVSGGLLHLLPGIPSHSTAAARFLEHHGYVFDQTPHFDLIHDLRRYTSPPGLPLATTRVADAADAEPLVAFLARSFPGSWEQHARWHFAAGGSPRDFVVLEVDGAIDGFCHIFRPNTWPPGPSTYWSAALRAPVGGLGPIGVTESLRGHGLGRRLLDAALLELKASGVHDCAIDWTRLVDFYGAFGFKPWRTYLRASKPLG
jgi:GNAT superfamily N-acetyltransferase